MSLLNHLPKGQPVTAKELLHLGNRAAVDQALSRLCRSGQILRIARGVYVVPVQGRFGARPPAVESTVAALAEQRGETIVSHGAATANRLGLTTQVPVREVYLTSGPNRELKLGAQVVELRHAPAWQLVLPGTPAGDVVRALAWLGKENAGEVLRTHIAPAQREALLATRAQMPTWMAREISGIASHA
jgi:hypothetical protein